MNKFIILIIIFLTIGCTKRIYIPVTRSTTITDTIKERIYDSTLLQAILECDSLNNVKIKELSQVKGNFSTQIAKLYKDTLKVKTIYQTKFIDRIVHQTDTVTLVDVQEVTKIVPTIPPLFWWCFGITIATIAYWLCKFFINS